MPVRDVGILGTGLVGASIGLGLRSGGARVTGWDPDPDVLHQAIDRGAVDIAASDEAAVLAAAGDLLVIGAPPAATCDLVGRLDHGQLTMDVAGVKAPVVEANTMPRFVGTHPMAGREVAGPAAASAVLFRGAAWVVVTDGASEGDLAAVGGVVTSLGARPVLTTAAEHDQAVAVVSHLPQLVAAALVATAGETEGSIDLAAGSFRDLTRVAASDPALWVDLLRTNRVAVTAALASLQAVLGEMTDALSGSDEMLAAMLSRSRAVRRGLTARAATVRVALADQPGELAKVGHALQVVAVDVRDIQLRHAPHGGGGVLTVSVRPGDADTLSRALSDEGLLIVD
ncbi:MAG: prephenate dehydrogenase [Acidimicrobiia bacterium]